jgi:uncharacterized protein
MTMPKPQPEVEIMREFAERVRGLLPGRIKAVYFYGSRVRGDAEEDSDYDVALVVDRRDRELDDQIFGLTAEWRDRYDAFVSPFITFEENFEHFRGAGIYREIEREGVRL